MPKSNALNKDVQYCTSLSLTSGLSGNIPVSCFNSGTSASSSTFLAYTTSMEWTALPEVVAGAQNSLAYFSAFERVIRPFSATPRSVFVYQASSTGGTGTLQNLQLNNGEFPWAFTANTATAGSFSSPGGVYIETGANYIGMGYNQNTVVVTSNTTMAVNTTYIVNSSSLVTLTCPSTFAQGQLIYVVGIGTGGWKIVQPSAGKQLMVGTSVSTSGTSGSVSSASPTDSIILSANNANLIVAVGTPESTGLIVV